MLELAEKKRSQMERKIEVRHVSLQIKADFESFTQALERLLGRVEHSVFKDLETDPRSVEETLKASAGEEGLMLFDLREHGKLLNILGSPRKAKQYVLGNPLIAVAMTRRDIRAGLYAPLRVFVYVARDQSTRIEFDQPSSLFGQFDNPEVTIVARSLDTKLANLINKAERLARAARAA
jgi:uncharacterized protein (DUF302 family)